jgi:hypothetical protein
MRRFAGRWVIVLLAWGAARAAPGAAPEVPAAEFFEKEVRPLLVERCLSCHDDAKAKGGLRLTGRARILEGGANGPAAVAGKPDDSLLVRAVRYDSSPRMPPKKQLDPRQVATLVRWVQLGLPWPEDRGSSATSFEIREEQRRFWSFQPVREPRVPAVRDGAWCKSPVDRFVLARLEAQGLAPVGDADRRTLIRRATFDLIGLPPSPEEVDAFLGDTSPDAFARVVDRLLSSPHYGERWGRHWLDVAHYADTAGETADFPVAAAYRYRNYVIAAFNADRPYDEFLREQVAGDLLAVDGPPERYAERVIATGFLAGARRFGFDPQNYHHLTIEDTIDTLGKAVLGLTVSCARCHDHKFDPVGREDYYALYGIFDSTRYPFPGSEEVKKPRDFMPLLPPALRGGKPAAELAYAVTEGKPHNARIHTRGDPLTPGAEAPRRWLRILGGDPLPAAAGSGRLQLAEWLTRPENPLTARVLVNRIWQHHFGEGLVRTPNNFGKQGRPPTHPELLDWLAHRFVAGGWSVKALHRTLLLSHTYQLSSAGDVRNEGADPENELLWHFDRRRLDAEAIRDALLAVGGNLERGIAGPHPFPPENTWGFTQHNPFQAVYPTNRRSVYLMTQRTRRHPFLALFDGADPNLSVGRRSSTTVPTQALFFLNNPFVHEQAVGLANRLLRHSGDDRARIAEAHRLAFGRPATTAEVAAGEDYLRRYVRELEAGGIPAESRLPQAWASYAGVLLAGNEFLYVD